MRKGSEAQPAIPETLSFELAYADIFCIGVFLMMGCSRYLLAMTGYLLFGMVKICGLWIEVGENVLLGTDNLDNLDELC